MSCDIHPSDSRPAATAAAPRLAVRALILDHAGRLLLVNAYPAGRSDLWCAPGGGVEAGASLPQNLCREVWEETGLSIEVGPLALVKEIHAPGGLFHQVEVFFHCRLATQTAHLPAEWDDPAGVVSQRRFVSRAELQSGALRFKPDALADLPWQGEARYDALEAMAR